MWQNSNLYTSLTWGVNDNGVPIEILISLNTICPVLLPTANMFCDWGCHDKHRGEFSKGVESVNEEKIDNICIYFYDYHIKSESESFRQS